MGDLDTLNGGTERDLVDLSGITNGAIWYDMGYNQFGANIGGVNLFLTNHNVITLNMESMIGTQFNDIMRGDSGSNFIDGGLGDDTLLSYSPYDTLTPLSSLGDVIIGGGGNDLLFSGTGNDYLDGGIGNDYFEPGAGSDTIITGTGNDTIWFFPRCGSDIITDFTAGAGIVDVIRITGFGTSLDSYAEIMANTTQVGADAHINLTGTTITLSNVNMASLVADDFLFV